MLFITAITSGINGVYFIINLLLTAIRFHGAVVHPDGGRVPVSTENLLLRECILKNTDFVEGIVIYAGHETKALLNNGGPRYKVNIGKNRNCNNVILLVRRSRFSFVINMHDDVLSALSPRKIYEQRRKVVCGDTAVFMRDRCVRLPILVVCVYWSAGDTVSADSAGASL